MTSMNLARAEQVSLLCSQRICGPPVSTSQQALGVPLLFSRTAPPVEGTCVQLAGWHQRLPILVSA